MPTGYLHPDDVTTTSTDPWHKRLTSARTRAGLSRAELAEKVGVSRGSVNEWERGARMPNGATLLAVEELLPDLRVTLEVSPVTGTDPRDPNGYAVHLPMDPARRARVLATLLQQALEEQSGR